MFYFDKVLDKTVLKSTLFNGVNHFFTTKELILKTKEENLINEAEKQKELIKDMGLDIFDSVIKETMRISVKDIEGYGIYVYFDNGDSTILGQYKTEERAKEVLKMIVSEYQSCKLFQCTNNATQEEMAKKYQEFSMTPFKFEMPQE